ncbi:hypothetical protein [Volucribacter amazonae]|nr:hypothetical protein [Volucribacter amazonae]
MFNETGNNWGIFSRAKELYNQKMKYIKFKLLNLQKFPDSIVKYNREYVISRHPEDIKEYDYMSQLSKNDKINFSLLSSPGVFIYISIEGWFYLLPIAQREWLNNFNDDINSFLETFFSVFENKLEFSELLKLFDLDNLKRFKEWLEYILIYDYNRDFAIYCDKAITNIIKNIDLKDNDLNFWLSNKKFPIDFLQFNRKYVEDKYPLGIAEYNYLNSLTEGSKIDFSKFSGGSFYISWNGWSYILPKLQYEWFHNYNNTIDFFMGEFIFHITYGNNIFKLLDILDKKDITKLFNWFKYIIIYYSYQSFSQYYRNNIKNLIFIIDDFINEN